MKNIKIDDDAFNDMKHETAYAYIYALLHPDYSMKIISQKTGVTYKRVRNAFLHIDGKKIQIHRKKEIEEPKTNYIKYKDDTPCAKWRNKLYNELIPFQEKYPKEMLHDFEEWWNQPNKSMTDCGWHMEKKWDLEARLRTWSKRQNNKQNFGRENIDDKTFSRW